MPQHSSLRWYEPNIVELVPKLCGYTEVGKMAYITRLTTDTGKFWVGKYKGMFIADVARFDRRYIDWMYEAADSWADRDRLAPYTSALTNLAQLALAFQ